MSDQAAKMVISEIRAHGYWEINIRPTVYKENRIPKEHIKGLIRSATVELRGWDYPHFSGEENQDPYPTQTGIENHIRWQNHIEFWRMTASANFLHLLALREDWMDLNLSHNLLSRGDELKGKTVLGVTGTLYTLTEIFEFAKRLAEGGIFEETAVISVTLHNIMQRCLFIDSYNKVPFFHDRVSHVNEWTLETSEYSVSELVSKSNEFSLNAVKQLFWIFGWEDLPLPSLKGDQEKFLQGRL